MGCKDCDTTKSSSHQEQARALSERALKLAMSLPDDVTCEKHFPHAEAAFLSALRNMAAGLSFAHSWSESEALTRADGLMFADAALAYGLAAARINNGGGTGASCTSTCTSEKDSCKNGCDANPAAGYFCYFDCRLSYFACLAGCIRHGNSGGGGGVVIA